ATAQERSQQRRDRLIAGAPSMRLPLVSIRFHPNSDGADAPRILRGAGRAARCSCLKTRCCKSRVEQVQGTAKRHAAPTTASPPIEAFRLPSRKIKSRGSL